MNLTLFKERIPTEIGSKLSDTTVAVWHSVYSHVAENGQTDRFDSSLGKRVRELTGRWASEATLQRHLKRMTDAGLFQSHRIRVRYTEIGKLMGCWGGLFGGDGPPAGVYLCYTLPGMSSVLTRMDKDSRSKPSRPVPARNESSPSAVGSTTA
jgi:hypothetical protein